MTETMTVITDLLTRAGEHMGGIEKKKSILVVDDQPKVLKFIEIDLKLRGFQVITTRSGEEALALIISMKPDVVLLDMIMPGMDGFEVLRRIRASGHLPVIAFSASPGNQDMAMVAGANEFMHKPFDPDYMARKINALLN
jgi:two-component system, OmpR family, KDP operon response regulator KdpE